MKFNLHIPLFLGLVVCPLILFKNFKNLCQVCYVNSSLSLMKHQYSYLVFLIKKIEISHKHLIIFLNSKLNFEIWQTLDNSVFSPQIYDKTCYDTGLT